MKVWLIDLCNKDETFFTTITIHANVVTEISGGLLADGIVIDYSKDLKLCNIVENK